jgi:hypothetical protein
VAREENQAASFYPASVRLNKEPPNMSYISDPIGICKQAFDAYAALRRLERDEPKLRDNPHFQALVDTAYARFRASYEVL